jgi:hypothetical protein
MGMRSKSNRRPRVAFAVALSAATRCSLSWLLGRKGVRPTQPRGSPVRAPHPRGLGSSQARPPCGAKPGYRPLFFRVQAEISSKKPAQTSHPVATSMATTQATTQNDTRLAMAALEKQRRGGKPTREEASALRRFEAQREEEQRQAHYRDIPKKDWRVWSGRQDKVLLEQAERYDFPMLRGASIDLPAFAKRFHDFLADNARKLAGPESDDPTLAGVKSPATEQKRRLECQKLELELAREQGLWIERRLIHEGHNRIGMLLRGAGEALLRQFGPDAQKILNDALDNCKREIDLLLDNDSSIDSDNVGGDRGGEG